MAKKEASKKVVDDKPAAQPKKEVAVEPVEAVSYTHLTLPPPPYV